MLAKAAVEVCEGTYWECTLGQRSALLVLALFIVSCGVVFEFLKELLEEHTKKAFHPILHAFYGELMVGGFLSLLSFILVFAGAFGSLSEKLFENEDILAEFMENLHVVIFLVFLIFMLQILVLLLGAYFTQRQWKRTEEAIQEKRPLVQGRWGWMISHEYAAIRSHFISPIVEGGGGGGESEEKKSLPPTFDFAHYLAEVYGVLIGEVVTVPFSVWLAVMFCFLILWAAAGGSMTVQLAVFCAMEGIVLGVAVAVTVKLHSIYKLLIPVIKSNDASGRGRRAIRNVEGHNRNDNNNSVNVDVENQLLIQPQDKDEAVAGVQISPPPYAVKSARLQPRSTIGKIIFGQSPNKHEALFWFGQRGPKFTTRLLSGVGFINALMMGLFGVWFSTTVWNNVNSVAIRFVLYAIVVIPELLVALVLLPHSIRLLVVCSKIELMKHDKSIQRTLVHQRTQKVMRTLRMLQSVRANLVESELGEIDPEKVLSEEKLESAKEVFRLFDNGDGSIEATELASMLHTMGAEVPKEHVDLLFSKLDKDKSGSIDLQEWLVFVSSTVKFESMQGPLTEEDAEVLFRLFDKTKSGDISVEEFSETFKSLGVDFTPSEVSSFVRELDHDESGTVNMEEFLHFVKKYSEQ